VLAVTQQPLQANLLRMCYVSVTVVAYSYNV